MQKARIIVSGNVHGVGFRNFVLNTAKGLGINGLVRNTDNNVEIIAEGTLEKLNHLINACKEGPMFSKVEHVDVKFEIVKVLEYADFWVE